ncbi:MAG: DUF616 domain-containing protein [Lachnospiraceae bacterium]|nr:DUF616 domain-containing protein [Lachnospiraceae bacterium]
MIDILDTVESRESINYYLLNSEIIKHKQNAYSFKRKKLSIENLRRTFEYAKLGAFSRIINRVGKKNADVTGFELKKYKSFPDKKIVVYTCIWGKYDTINEPMYVNKNIDYVIITNQNIPKSSAWKKIDISKLLDIKGKTDVEINRMCKMLPHLIFPDYDYSIYIDGNIRIITDMMPIISDMGENVIGIHEYPEDCIYEMKNAVIVGKRAKKEDLLPQIEKYKKEGFPEHFGAFECNIIARKHNDKNCIELMNSWWEEFQETPSKRDQFSFVYVLWKHGLKADYVFSLGYNVRFNPRFQIVHHSIK